MQKSKNIKKIMEKELIQNLTKNSNYQPSDKPITLNITKTSYNQLVIKDTALQKTYLNVKKTYLNVNKLKAIRKHKKILGNMLQEC